MQTRTTRDAYRRRPQRSRSMPLLEWLGGALLTLVVLTVMAAGIIYFGWDYLPDSVIYRIRAVQGMFDDSPRPAAVPTPSGQQAPSDVLAQLVLTPAATPTSILAAATAIPEATATTVASVSTDTTTTVPTATATLPPPTETPVPPTATPVPLHQPAAAAMRLEGVRHEYQGWNNCGPTTLAMNLSYYGRPETQREIAPFVKPDREDKNVTPEDMAAYAAYIGYEALIVVALDVPMLKTFISNGIPVMVETWYIPDPDDEMGHYLLLTGYDGDTLYFQDSYHGPNVAEPAAEFDPHWKVFNRTAVLVYPPEQRPLVDSILGELADPAKMHERSLALAYADVQANPQDKFGWFNLGTTLTAMGDYANAASAFDTARSLSLPWRMLWYQFGPYQAYYEVGRYEEVIALTDSTIQGAGNLEESFYWRGRAYAALGNVDAARRDFQTALQYNSKFTPAQEALNSLG